MAEIFVVLSLGSLSVLLYSPQIFRILKTRITSGVSELSLLVGLSNYVGWTYLLFASDSTGAALANLVGLGVWLTLVVVFLKYHKNLREASWLWWLVWTTVLTAAAFVGGVPLLGLILNFGALVSFVPAVKTAWTDTTIEGLSATSWVLSFLNGLTWIVSGVMYGTVQSTVNGSITLVASGLVLGAIVVRGSRRTFAASSTH